MVNDLFTKHANGIKIIVASRFEETAVYPIYPTGAKTVKQKNKKPAFTQLKFSF